MHSLVEGTDSKEWILSGGGNRLDHGCGFEPAYPGSKIPELAENEGKYANLFYRIRKEGFVGLESIALEAEVVFKAVDIIDDNVYFNISAPLGRVKFQASSAPGKPIDGFAFEDCKVFSGDETRYRPEWKNKDLRELKGRKVVFELKMYMATLYSLSGDIMPHQAHKLQKSLGDVKIYE